MNVSFENNDFRPPWYLLNPHLQTIIPSVFRFIKNPGFVRTRIQTADNDFLDLDIINKNSNKTAIICHGLEGNSRKNYIKGMARVFLKKNYNVIAWNYRGCSGETNRLPVSYHSGATDDLELVTCEARKRFSGKIVLIGFSLGGNLVLKYLGENRDHQNDLINKCIAISVPLDLYGSCKKIDSMSFAIYRIRFLRKLKKKIRHKSIIFPKKFNIIPFREIRTLQSFDDHYTAPLHGFKNALDYYSKCSSINFLSHITIPTLIINAKNDPFLSSECYPDVKNLNKNIHTLYPDHGGHVGFYMTNPEFGFFHEKQAIIFAES